MPDRIHLKPKHRQILEELIRENLPNVEVWAYGSRVNGRSHDGGDLDLVLRAPDLQQISSDRLIEFKHALRESTIPFLVEARDWSRLPERFHKEIERQYIVLFEKKVQFYPAYGLTDRQSQEIATAGLLDFQKLRNKACWVKGCQIGDSTKHPKSR